MRPRTVAIIGTRGYPSYYGGFETAVRRIAPAFADSGWRVRVYERPGAVRDDDPGLDPRVERVATRGINSSALSTLSFGLTSVLHALLHKPDVALVMNVANGFWLPLLRLRGIPTVVNVDGIEWHRDKWSRLGKLVFFWGARLTARFADDLVFDAVAIGAYWTETFGRTGVFIPYGGDAAPTQRLEEQLVGKRYVLLVARFVPENSVAAFIEAAPKIVEQCDVDVVLVGSAPEGDPIQEAAHDAAASHERINLLGHVSDDSRLTALWQHASAYFHGHTVGGTNPALVQAMALGSTIVARDTVYNREVLADTGRFCTSDLDDIVDTISAALGAADELGPAARRRAAEHYTWDRVVTSYVDVVASHA